MRQAARHRLRGPLHPDAHQGRLRGSAPRRRKVPASRRCGARSSLLGLSRWHDKDEHAPSQPPRFSRATKRTTLDSFRNERNIVARRRKRAACGLADHAGQADDREGRKDRAIDLSDRRHRHQREPFVGALSGSGWMRQRPPAIEEMAGLTSLTIGKQRKPPGNPGAWHLLRGNGPPTGCAWVQRGAGARAEVRRARFPRLTDSPASRVKAEPEPRSRSVATRLAVETGGQAHRVSGSAFPRCNGDLRSNCGGGGGIRTHGTLPRTPVFKTGAFDHSATPPVRAWYRSPRDSESPRCNSARTSGKPFSCKGARAKHSSQCRQESAQGGSGWVSRTSQGRHE